MKQLGDSARGTEEGTHKETKLQFRRQWRRRKEGERKQQRKGQKEKKQRVRTQDNKDVLLREGECEGKAVERAVRAAHSSLVLCFSFQRILTPHTVPPKAFVFLPEKGSSFLSLSVLCACVCVASVYRMCCCCKGVLSVSRQGRLLEEREEEKEGKEGKKARRKQRERKKEESKA